MYRTILFDFDGTLVPSLDLWLQAFQYAISKYGREIPEQTIIDRFYYRDYADVCAEFEFPNAVEMEKHVHEGLTTAYEAAELFDDARQVLDAVRAAGMKTGLVTSSPRLQVSVALSRLGIDDKFDTIVTGDDIVNFKPHPEPVLLALSNLGEQPGETLFVGDYIFDVLAGNAAGTTTVLFLPDRHTRFYDFDKLRATGPDLTFTSYRDLAHHLDLRI
jgi:pyrophosphatase PpaX